MKTRKLKKKEIVLTLKVFVNWDEKKNIYAYRLIEIASGASLYHLAEAINESMGFTLDQSFGFYDDPKNPYQSKVGYEDFADIGEPSDYPGVKKTTVQQAFSEFGMLMLYVFDYEDEWRFPVQLAGLFLPEQEERQGEYPCIIRSVGDSPERYPDEGDDTEQVGAQIIQLHPQKSEERREGWLTDIKSLSLNSTEDKLLTDTIDFSLNNMEAELLLAVLPEYSASAVSIKRAMNNNEKISVTCDDLELTDFQISLEFELEDTSGKKRKGQMQALINRIGKVLDKMDENETAGIDWGDDWDPDGDFEEKFIVALNEKERELLVELSDESDDWYPSLTTAQTTKGKVQFECDIFDLEDIMFNISQALSGRLSKAKKGELEALLDKIMEKYDEMDEEEDDV